MNTARHQLSRGAEITPGSILSVVGDDHTMLCLDESAIDAWFLSLSPESKADVYETQLNDHSGMCRFCGGTDDPEAKRFLVWIDPLRTVCDTMPCILARLAELAEATGPIPLLLASSARLRLDAASGAIDPALLTGIARVLATYQAYGQQLLSEGVLREIPMDQLRDRWSSMAAPMRRRCTGRASAALQQEVADASL